MFTKSYAFGTFIVAAAYAGHLEIMAPIIDKLTAGELPTNVELLEGQPLTGIEFALAGYSPEGQHRDIIEQIHNLNPSFFPVLNPDMLEEWLDQAIDIKDAVLVDIMRDTQAFGSMACYKASFIKACCMDLAEIVGLFFEQGRLFLDQKLVPGGKFSLHTNLLSFDP